MTKKAPTATAILMRILIDDDSDSDDDEIEALVPTRGKPMAAVSMPLVACQATYSIVSWRARQYVRPEKRERYCGISASVRLFERSSGGLSHRPYSAELFDSLATLAQFSETGRLFCGTYDERTCQFMGTHFPLLWISQNADRS